MPQPVWSSAVCWEVNCFFLNPLRISGTSFIFSMTFVLLWSSRNVLWTLKRHPTFHQHEDEQIMSFHPWLIVFFNYTECFINSSAALTFSWTSQRRCSRHSTGPLVWRNWTGAAPLGLGTTVSPPTTHTHTQRKSIKKVKHTNTHPAQVLARSFTSCTR